MLEKGIYILMKNYFSELQKDTKSTTYRRRHCHVLEMVEVKGVTYPVMSVVPTEEKGYIPEPHQRNEVKILADLHRHGEYKDP